MRSKQNNYAFIDGNNLYYSIKAQGWALDYKRFRVYLRDKYDINKAFLFIGYIRKNRDLYNSLKSQGYNLVFKPILPGLESMIKGNVDAELVLHTIKDIEIYDKAIVITGDGDFHCLIKYLIEKEKLLKLIIPNKNKYSSLFRKFMPYIEFMNNLKNKLKYEKKGRREALPRD